MLNPVALSIISNTFTDPVEPGPRNRDPVGQVLVITALASLTYPIIEGPGPGWASAKTLGCLSLAATARIALIGSEPRRGEPLIDLRFFRSAPFSGATVVTVFAFSALGASGSSTPCTSRTCAATPGCTCCRWQR